MSKPKLHPHMMPPEHDTYVEVKSMEFVCKGKLPSAEEYQRLIDILTGSSLCEQCHTKREAHLRAITLRCVGCKHPRHRKMCVVPYARWRVWLTGLKVCSCTYWDARWEK